MTSSVNLHVHVLVTYKSVFFTSSGLDSAVAFGITADIRAWCHTRQGTVVAALLQPTPEIYDLFDDVLLLREGRVVFHGPRDALPKHLVSLGFPAPSPAPVQASESPVAESREDDIADWALRIISDAQSRKVRDASEHSCKILTAHSEFCLQGISEAVPVTTADMARAWQESDLCLESASPRTIVSPIVLASRFAKAQYGMWHPRNLVFLAIIVLVRRKCFSCKQPQLAFTRRFPLCYASTEWNLTLRNYVFIVRAAACCYEQ